MRLIVTGGGTGGHVYPALEVARAGREAGWELRYLGSFRGIEGAQCARHGIEFQGFASEPVLNLLRPSGWRSLIRLARTSAQAARALREWRADIVFATGGYSAAPILTAARRLKVPFVIHEQNSVPGRTLRVMGRHAAAVCTVFRGASRWFPPDRTTRTGMPVRVEIRASNPGRPGVGESRGPEGPVVLVMGGSQGSVALNDAALATAVRMAPSEVHWLHLSGVAHFERTMESLRKLGVTSGYSLRAYLDGGGMAAALSSSSVVVCRSGAGTLAELAALRKPSILVPFPHAFADHQRLNAMEFTALGAADLLPQSGLEAPELERRLQAWLSDRDRRAQAERALADWDVPDATSRILGILAEAAG